MRERVATLACAFGALLLIGTLLLRGDPAAARRASLPTSIERADNGLLGAMSWLRSEGVATLALRERFGALTKRPGLAADGNLLIVSLPAASAVRVEEAVALDHWIRAGNTLLVLAALRDRPGWAQFPWLMSSDLQLLSELGIAPASGREQHVRRSSEAHAGNDAARERLMQLATALSSPELGKLEPNRAHRYFTGVAQAVAFSDYVPLGNTLELELPRDGFALSLAHEAGSGADAFWIRRHGEGMIIVSGFATLFSNRALGRADNARLLANVVAASVTAHGTVVFDDEHQGLTDGYDPALFYRDPRLYATLAVIAAVWLSWVLGATQLQTPLPRQVAPREAELVRTTGMFLARVLRPAAAARRLLEQFLQRVSAAAGRDTSDPMRLWQWLENHPRLSRADVHQLHEWYSAAQAQRRVPLIRLHNLIVRAERELAQ
jgi:hypothetical protein